MVLCQSGVVQKLQNILKSLCKNQTLSQSTIWVISELHSFWSVVRVASSAAQ